ncbi:hypothetical protein [Sphingomonas sp. URHD0057]|uniref:hypothetical protein n=1 Tax=Sphingomonas sp. URHD0057 TaxID=1380389 RepID=UPI00048B9E94|nr:hypothetical protein [Sphingomonas sp. URHD0057]
MSDSPQPATDVAYPAAENTADPEIAALLAFEPVPRKRIVEGGWTPDLQREFIARLALGGSPGRACDEMGKNLTGMMKLYRSPLAASFRASWHAAVEIAKRRQAEQADMDFVAPGTRPPSIDHRRKHAPSPWPSAAEGDEGMVMNEYGEWEDEASYHRRAEEARESIAGKLLRIRRIYLQEISASAAKRAAFEILTELPIDWDKASALEAQADEPWRSSNQRQPDMVLLAESGWSYGECGYGPDKKAEMRAAIDEYRSKQGLEAVNWDEGDGNED